MQISPEFQRLQALHEYDILDKSPEEEYDIVTKIAAQICQTPVAFISFIDDSRQWFKSKVGFDLTDVTPPLEASRIPKTLFAMLRNKTLNCSTKSILFSSQVCLKRSAASLDVFI